MNDQPEKVRVVRLIKKPVETGPAATAASPPIGVGKDPSPRPQRQESQSRSPAGHTRRIKLLKKQSGAGRDQAPPGPKPASMVLTDDQRDKILERYRGMVVSGERPAEGRRKQIAADLNIPYATVAEVVRAYVTYQRYRRTNFDIEKAYWSAVRAGETDARAIAKQIAEQIGFDEGRVWWWMEKLHEPRKAFARDPEVDEEKRCAIVAAYESYLQQADPPKESLHKAFADQVGGITPRQVHKVLWEYRMKTWSSLAGTEKRSIQDTSLPDESQ